MSNYRFQRELMIAAATYPEVLSFLTMTLQEKAAELGAMSPGCVEQLAVNPGFGVTENGVPYFLAAVKRRRNVPFRSPMAFGQAVQEALDEVAYANCLNRLVLQRVDLLPNGYIGLTLTIGG